MTQVPNTKDVSFNFRARKVILDGNIEGHGKKQPKLSVSIPVPTPQQISEAILFVPPEQELDAKNQPVPYPEEIQQKIRIKELFLDSLHQPFVDQVKEQLDTAIDGFGADESKVISTDYIDWDKVTPEYIANIPPSQRGASAISDEEWETLFKDYLAVMPVATGKTEDKLKKHIEIFKSPTKVKTRKDLLPVLIGQIQIYKSSTANLEDTAVQADRLEQRFTKWLNEDEKLVADSL